jgi:hypothetical protein
MSIKDHRQWVERNIGLLPPAPVKIETIARAVAHVAAALGQTEQQLIGSVVADCAYTPLERKRVEEWAREVITLAANAWTGPPGTGPSCPTTPSSTRWRRSSPRSMRRC